MSDTLPIDTTKVHDQEQPEETTLPPPQSEETTLDETPKTPVEGENEDLPEPPSTESLEAKSQQASSEDTSQINNKGEDQASGEMGAKDGAKDATDDGKDVTKSQENRKDKGDGAEGEDEEFHDPVEAKTGEEDEDYDEYEPDTAKALEAKERGNKHFGKGEYFEALDCYAEALLRVEDHEVEHRALFHNNKAAAHFMLKQWDEVVYETTQAIHLKQGFAKAYLRRAKAFEAMDKLTEALDDYKVVQNLEPNDKDVAKKVKDIGAKVQKRFEEQKDEMINKLKDLGNSLLGKFGMNLDQFKAVQDPKTGSYSISFGNNTSASPDANAGSQPPK